ncbi:MAG: peptide MFS transporter [Bryobacteraceae bacterium]|nr:peptide MFS transporter [Bryobacteraceae bacterium]
MTDTSFFGHPRGLRTLFFTEVWERWGYYGMRSLLILFMTAAVSEGGLGFDVAKASAIYGLYTAMVYMASLPGGWIADRILGQRRTVFVGGAIMTVGYFLLAADTLAAFYTGLVLVVIGTGLLKPNVSTIVGQLYQQGDPRRDAGFSIFYMGINLGAFVAPLACGWVARFYGWRAGMALAGAGMLVGLVQYLAGGKNLGEAGLHPVHVSAADDRRQRSLLFRSLAITAVVALAVMAADGLGLINLTAERLSQLTGVGLTILTIALFAWLLLAGDWSPVERRRIYVIAVLFLASTLFWSVFEQAGSTLNLFAARSTDTTFLGWNYPPSWFQSVNGLFIVLFAPVFAWIWIKLGTRDPSSPAKFSLALIQVGLGFVVLVGGALLAAGGTKVSPTWLLVTYFFHTTGELCLSPVGLSAFTKLAPARVAGFMMGVWFLSISLGNFLGGRIASFYEALPLPQLLAVVGGFAILAGLILAMFTKPIVRLMGGAK